MSSNTPKLTRKHAVVEFADERIVTVRILNADSIRYEETAERHGWPGVRLVDGVTSISGTSLRATFETWAALKRTGQYDATFEQFRDHDCADITVDEEEVDPTQLAPAVVSSPSSHGSDAAPMTSSVEQTTS